MSEANHHVTGCQWQCQRTLRFCVNQLICVFIIVVHIIEYIYKLLIRPFRTETVPNKSLLLHLSSLFTHKEVWEAILVSSY